MWMWVYKWIMIFINVGRISLMLGLLSWDMIVWVVVFVVFCIVIIGFEK